MTIKTWQWYSSYYQTTRNVS